MSMLCLIGQISDADINKLFEDPKRVEQLLNDGEFFEEKKQSFFKALFSKAAKPVYNWKPDAADLKCELDKSWHVLHFILSDSSTGGEFPGNFIMTGGAEVGEDYGYGPIRVFTSSELKQIASFIETISEQNVKSKLNMATLKGNDLYGIYDELENEPFDDVFDYFIALKEFILKTKAANKGIYTYIY